MKEIKLTSSKYGQRYAKVDDSDFERLNKFQWFLQRDSKSKNRFYATRAYRKSNGKFRHVKMHREILGLTDPKVWTDHKDHEGLNNQRNNIRIATASQNNHNRSIQSKSQTGFIGVLPSGRKLNPWRVRIVHEGKIYRLGQFKTKEEAALAFNKKALELRGEFANLNKI